jgi:dipeptidyl-peptidase-4
MDLEKGDRQVMVSKAMLKPALDKEALPVENFELSTDGKWVLIFTNTARVWRFNTRGDYWLLNIGTKSLRQLGKGRPTQSLMFAKLSPDGTKVAYVSEKNIYMEDVGSGKITALTKDGGDKMINGTFDWVYEEEFFLRDGFRWSPDSRRIGYWQVNARGTRDFYMINNTDSIYSRIVPVEYPKVGQPISKVRVGVVDVQTAQTKWMNIPGAPDSNYLVRMEWHPSGQEMVVQQLDRAQQRSRVFLCQSASGVARKISEERDDAWIDLQASWSQRYKEGGWDWLQKGSKFIWSSEKDGWRHLYAVGTDGKEQLLTKGDYDVIELLRVDEVSGHVYFMASPDDATSSYLYRTRLDGQGNAERLSPPDQRGTHSYDISPGARFAYHRFSNYYTPSVSELIALPAHRGINGQNRVADAVRSSDSTSSTVSFFKVKTEDGVEMDAWMRKPYKFDPAKKYPVVFEVYTEPAAQTVKNSHGIGDNQLYNGDMADDGYIYISMDNRGTPAPKGRAWRKAIYKKIGTVNIRDQAMGAKQILKLPYIDSSRVAVWGWSGGGSATLNLLFQYPEIYKTGIAIAAVANQLSYDNIYQERYMGPPFSSVEDYVKGSPMTYAKNLKGNLLYIHGTGDDNVHYQNAEILVNELIRYNKQFQFMPYPNRSHGIYEGDGTTIHLITLYSEFLRKNCPPGGK